MKKGFVLMMALLMVISLAACANKAPATETPAADAPAATDNGATETPAAAEVPIEAPKVAIVQGVRGDKGFNDQAYHGMEMAAADFGITFDGAECTDLAEVDAALRNYADTGDYDLIVAVGSNYGDSLALVASDYPDQKFSLVDTSMDPAPENLHWNAAIDAEQGFLSGVISGFVTKGDYPEVFTRANADKNVIVYAGGADSPTSRAGAAGYMAGVYYVNPDCEIIYNIVGSYNDPVKAKEIAMNGVARGADIITGNCGSGSMGLKEAANEAGCYFIATALSSLDPVSSLCTSVKLTENQVYDEIKAIVEGTWKSGGERKGIAAGYCDYSVEGVSIDFPQELLDKVDAVREAIKNGQLQLPTDVDQLDAWKATNQFQG